MGAAHFQRRLNVEEANDAHGRHLRGWFGKRPLLHAVLTLTGLRERGRRNASSFELRENRLALPRMPAAFEGFALLHLTDLHLDLDAQHASRLADFVARVKCDACVLTGDYRFGARGAWEPAVESIAKLRPHLPASVHAVLGNHDSIRMVPALEQLGVRVLLNESVRIESHGAVLHLAGIDDAHYFRTHDLRRAAQGIPGGACAMLLSHTPEPYREAAGCGFGAMLCGHTHGGQICLPGRVPMLTDSDAPRAFARGAWRYREMAGYTSAGCGCSVIDARFNCPPEVTLHRLAAAR
jgi:predicted MPP superfamily phosphohydrolase